MCISLHYSMFSLSVHLQSFIIALCPGGMDMRSWLNAVNVVFVVSSCSVSVQEHPFRNASTWEVNLCQWQWRRKQNEGLFRAADQHFHVVCELFTVFLFSVNWINSNLNLPLETKHVFNNGILSPLSVIFNSPPNPVPYTCLRACLCTYSHSPPNGCLSENGLN